MPPYFNIMDKTTLPTSITIKDIECKFNADFRNILYVFQALNDPDLLDSEKIGVALYLFYDDENYSVDVETAIKEMFSFITMSENEPENSSSSKPLFDWEQDYNLIIAPINKALGYDVRGVEYLHWWTFLSAFMEIGECTFSTYVSIRNKLNKGKKLEKYEKDIMKEHRNSVILKKKYDSTTQSLMDEIMGYGG